MAEDIVAVTGASGFLGSEVVRQLCSRGMTVVATDLLPAADLARDSRFVRSDVTDMSSLPQVFAGVHTAIHLAGLAHVLSESSERAADFDSVNVRGTANVVGAALDAGVRHLVLASSVAVYGPQHGERTEDAPCRPTGPYALSKLNAERHARSLAGCGGLRVTILRLGTLYGEQDKGNVVRLISAIDRSRFIWVGDGRNRKSLLHREDAALSCLAALRVPDESVRVFNVAGPPSPVSDVVTIIASALGRSIPRVRVPRRLAALAASVGAFGPGRSAERAEHWTSG